MSNTFEVQLQRLDGYQFRVDFASEGVPPLVVDEPPPLGQGAGPNPARLLATAVGSCLSASLLFCLSKARVEVGGIETAVTGTYRRNERGRLRIGRLDVVLEVDAPDASELGKCLDLFEDFCVVTESVRAGVDVGVTVTDNAGKQLYESRAEAAR